MKEFAIFGSYDVFKEAVSLRNTLDSMGAYEMFKAQTQTLIYVMPREKDDVPYEF